MTEHTPGPWLWDAIDSPWDIVNAEGYTVVGDAQPMSDADGRLIAAAPDLLKAAQDSAHWLEACGDGCWTELTALKRAIAKATGELN